MPEHRIRVYLTETATHSFVITVPDPEDTGTVADAAEGIFTHSRDPDDLENYDCQFSNRAYSHLDELSVFDNTQAHAEGWGLFNSNEIQRDDEAAVFLSDDDATRFVRHRAKQGSAYHQAALDADGG